MDTSYQLKSRRFHQKARNDDMLAELLEQDLSKEEQKVCYEYVAHQIEREDGLIHNRLTWMLTTQGFLFTALILIGQRSQVSNIMFDLLIDIIPLTGVILSLMGFVGVFAAYLAISDLKKWWKRMIYIKYPRPFGGKQAHRLGLAPSLLLPVLLGLIWLDILIKL